MGQLYSNLLCLFLFSVLYVQSIHMSQNFLLEAALNAQFQTFLSTLVAVWCESEVICLTSSQAQEHKGPTPCC